MTDGAPLANATPPPVALATDRKAALATDRKAALATDRKAGSLAVQISNAVVQVYRAYTGRGPTKSRTVIDNNLIVVELRETLTTGERNLVAAGEQSTVIETRRAYRRLVHQPLIDATQRLVGREVLALLGDIEVDEDIAVEVFVLAPEPVILRAD